MNLLAQKGVRSLIIVESKMSVGDLSQDDLRGKRVFVRADLNVPLDSD